MRRSYEANNAGKISRLQITINATLMRFFGRACRACRQRAQLTVYAGASL